MKIKNKGLNLLYIATLVVISGYGLTLALGIHEGHFFILPLSYSNLSSIICFAYFLVCLIRGIFIQFDKKRDKEINIFPILKGAIMMCVAFTLIIFHFMLSRGTFNIPGTNYVDWRNIIVHYITPLMAIIHWLLFDRKGVYKIVWLSIPIGYLLFALIYAEVGTIFFYDGTIRYPYYFINPDQIGWASVTAFVAVLIVFFLILGNFVCFIDNYLEKAVNEKN